MPVVKASAVSSLAGIYDDGTPLLHREGYRRYSVEGHGPTTKNLDLDRMATQAMFVHALEQA